MKKKTDGGEQTKSARVKDTEVLTLRKPLDIDGTKLTTLTLHFGGLTGEDLEAAEMQVRAEGIDIPTAAELCKPFLFAVAARAAKINRAYILQLSVKDASAVSLLTQGFLLG